MRRSAPRSSEEIAAHVSGTAVVGLSRSQATSAVCGTRLGYDAVRAGAGYASGFSECDVDALLFEKGVKDSGAWELDDVDDIDDEFAEGTPICLRCIACGRPTLR